MSYEAPCPQCNGTGKIDVPEIEDKVAQALLAGPPDAGTAFALSWDDMRQIGVRFGLVSEVPDATPAPTPDS
jgi:hypothetical protein